MKQEPSYGQQFFDKLVENLQKLEGQLDTDDSHHVKKSSHNTELIANTLRITFCDMGDIAGALTVGASCELGTVIKES